jgi:uncharacterized protein with HEPN domain
MKDDKLYLIHMQECILRIEKYTAGGKMEFLQQEIIQDTLQSTGLAEFS